MNRYASSLEHLMAELERIDLRLRLQVTRMRQRYGQPGSDEFRGLYISEEEIDDLMASSYTTQAEADLPSLSDSPLFLRLIELDEEISQTRAQGEGHLRLSYATSKENIEVGLERIKKALA